ncbi:unnamed protein product [Somion occarium]
MNKLSPIYILPSELLAEIFLLLQPCTDAGAEATRRPGPYTWIRVTHVCHHFRQVARENPRLWSYIELPRNSNVPVFHMLERSKQAPLAFKAHLEWLQPEAYGRQAQSNSMKVAVNAVLAQFHRVFSIRVCAHNTIMKSIIEKFGGSLPLLYSIVLDNCSSRSLASPPAFPSTGDLPRLERVHLTGYPISSIRQFLRRVPRLKYLKIPQFTDSDSMSALLAILQSLPLLESLILSRGMLSTKLDTAPIAQATLPKLSYLSFALKDTHCAKFLDSLIIPSNTAMSITVDAGIFDVDNAAGAVLSVVSKVKGAGISGPLISLASASIDIQQKIPVLVVKAWSQGATLSLDEKACTFRNTSNPRLTIMVPDHIPIAEKVLDTLCRERLFSDVSTLAITGLDRTSSETWIQRLDRMRCVEKLTVNESSSGTLTGILEAVTTDVLDKYPQVALLPNLTNVHLHCGAFLHPFLHYTSGPPPLRASSLRYALQWRMDNGYKLGLLRLSQTRNFLTPDELKPIVGELQWTIEEARQGYRQMS